MIIVVNHTRLAGKYALDRNQGNTSKQSLVGLGERLSGKCPLCNGSITEGGELVVCPSCLTVYHLRCIDEILSYNKNPDSSFKCVICGHDIPVATIKKLKEGGLVGGK